MPTSLIGLLIFVAVITPGLCCTVARGLRVPGRKVSALYETAVIVSISVICLITTLGFLALIRLIWPDITPDVGQLLRQPHDYIVGHHFKDGGFYINGHFQETGTYEMGSHFPLVATWVLVLGITSCVLGAVLGWGSTWVSSKSNWSAWRYVFEANVPPNSTIYVACALKDGTYIAGDLYTYASDSEETADREITLQDAKIQQEDGTMLDLQVGVVSISAGNIQWMSTSYIV